MQNRQQRAARMLAWAGVIPFLALVGVSYLGAPLWLSEVLLGYALLILAFMCGSLWTGALARPAESPAPLIASNVLVLAALPSLLLPLTWAAGWLALLFALHGLAEWRWVHVGQPGWYRRLRMMISTAVVLLLLLAMLPGFANA
ncbi:MAG: DUF3429 domain-containing protein [Wenzhouxiangellaceae bacterium]|nr:DUF3429 domain-containing protein [Wenzhouxiangellaceae bacterium]